MKKLLILLIFFTIFIVPLKLQATEEHSLNIIEPLGGEEYKPGQTVRISWNQKNVDNVIILLYLSEGNVSHISSDDGLVVEKSATSSFFDWVIPDNILASGEIKKTGLKIMITAYDSGIGSTTSYSNNFSISTNDPYLLVSLDSSSPQGKLSYSSDLVTAKFKLQAQGGDLHINNLNLYLKDQNNLNYFVKVDNLKLINAQGIQINSTADLSFNTINLKETLNILNGNTENVTISFDPYKTFLDYAGGDFNFCIKYLPSNTGYSQGDSAAAVAICANKVSTDKKVILPDLKILSTLAQPAVGTNIFDLAVYFSRPQSSSSFIPYKIKLVNKKDGKTYYAEVTNSLQTNVDFILPFGAYQGEFMIDSDNVVKESDETNNILLKDISYCGSNQIANCGGSDESNEIVLKISSPDDYYGGQTKIYYGNNKNINLMNIDLVASTSSVKLNSLNFSPFNSHDYLANLVNLRLMNGETEIARVDRTFAADYWNDPKIPKVPGYFNFSDINFTISANEKKKLSVIAELGTPITETVNYFSYDLIGVSGTKNDGTEIHYGTGSMDKAGMGNLPIKGLKIIIKPAVPVTPPVATTTPFISTTTPPAINPPIVTIPEGSLCSYYDEVAGCDYSKFTKINVQTTSTRILIPKMNATDVDQLVLILKNKVSDLAKQVMVLEEKLTNLNAKFAEKYAGTMFLDVENKGRLWYVDPESKNRFYFENGASALSIGSQLALGVSYENISKIPVGVPDKLYNLTDTDADGLPDRLETALGSDPTKADTDGDGYNDKQELSNGYEPINNLKYQYSQDLIKKLEGKMLLQVDGPNSHGEIWYIKDGQRWYGGTADSMYEIMKAQSLGATAEDIRKIEVGGVINQ